MTARDELQQWVNLSGLPAGDPSNPNELERIDHLLLQQILETIGWSQVGGATGLFAAWSPSEDSDEELLVPLNPEKGDYAVMLRRARNRLVHYVDAESILPQRTTESDWQRGCSRPSLCGAGDSNADRTGGGVMEPYYSDDLVTLYHGDCLEVMTSMEDGAVTAVLTDPPYSSGGRRENSRSLRKSMTRTVPDDDWIRGDAMSTNGFTYLLRMCGIQWRRILTPGGHVLSFIDWRMAWTLAAALETADLRQHPILVWDKGRLGMGAVFRNQHEFIVHMSSGVPLEPQRRDVANVLTFPPIRGGDHPTEKPEPLLRTLLSVVAPAGSLVLDPFAGSGATLTAATSLGMRAIGIEADERYCEIIAKRLSNQTMTLDFGGAS